MDLLLLNHASLRILPHELLEYVLENIYRAFHSVFPDYRNLL